MAWHIENMASHETRGYEIKKELFSKISKYQNIRIVDFFSKGISLILDDHVRVFESDEFVFHEGFVHSIMQRQKSSEVLVIGDGDGGLIRELLKYKNIQKIDWVEIDEDVIDACEKYLPYFPHDYKDESKVNVIAMDGVEYLDKVNNKKYDTIFVSVTAGGNNDLSSSFKVDTTYRLLHSALKKDGLIGFSLDEVNPILHEEFANKISTLKSIFHEVKPFYLDLPSFGSSWGFAICSPNNISEVRQNIEIDGLRYYCEKQVIRDFQIPKRVLE